MKNLEPTIDEEFLIEEDSKDAVDKPFVLQDWIRGVNLPIETDFK